MNEQITIRNVRVEDAQNLINYCNQVGGESDNLSFGKDQSALTLQEEEEHISSLDDNNIYLIAVYENQIVGAASINSISKVRLKHNGTIGISILKKYCSNGLGTMMIEQLINQVRARSQITNLYLEVRADNDLAIKLYTKFGFKQVGVLPNNFKINNQYFDINIMYRSLN